MEAIAKMLIYTKYMLTKIKQRQCILDIYQGIVYHFNLVEFDLLK